MIKQVRTPLIEQAHSECNRPERRRCLWFSRWIILVAKLSQRGPDRSSGKMNPDVLSRRDLPV